MKKLLALLLSTATVSGGVTALADTTEKNINVFTNYVNIEIDSEPKNVRNFLTEDGTTYIALRDVSELLNCTVDWDDTTKTAVITTNAPSELTNNAEEKSEFVEETIAVLEDYVNVTIDGVEKDIRNFLSNETTYIALRDVSELLGCNVEWVDTTKTAVITSQTPAEIAMTIDGKPVSIVDFANMYADIDVFYGDEKTQEEKIQLTKDEFSAQAVVDKKVDELGFDRAAARAVAEEDIAMMEEGYGVEQVELMLAQSGYTRESYIDEYVKSILQDELLGYMQETFPEYKEIEDGAEDYYNSHKSDYKEHSVYVKHILIPTTDENGEQMSEAEQKEALKTANAIQKKATVKNFDSLIAENNNDPGQPEEGYFVTENSQFVPEFEEAALKLKKNQISKPVKTVYGYHIILATEVNEYVPYETFLETYLIEKWGEIDVEYFYKWIAESEVVCNDDIINAAVALAEHNID